MEYGRTNLGSTIFLQMVSILQRYSIYEVKKFRVGILLGKGLDCRLDRGLWPG